jgi:hypothetical protein
MAFGPNSPTPSPTPSVDDYNKPVVRSGPIRPSLTAEEERLGLTVYEAMSCRKYGVAPGSFSQLIDAFDKEASDLTAQEAEWCGQWYLATGVFSVAKKLVKVTKEEMALAEAMHQPPNYTRSMKACQLSREVVDHVAQRKWKAERLVK